MDEVSGLISSGRSAARFEGAIFMNPPFKGLERQTTQARIPRQLRGAGGDLNVPTRHQRLHPNPFLSCHRLGIL